MPTYSAKIYLGDHPGDLHLHLFLNVKNSRKLLGKFKIPSLEQLPGDKHDLTNKEYTFIANWLKQPQQERKLTKALELTLFNLHDVAGRVAENLSKGSVQNKKGKTFITVSIPIIDRLR